MPEYDAFGREIGEDTLSGLGGNDADSRSRARPAGEWTAEQIASASAPAEPAAPAPASAPVTALQPGSPLQPQQPQAQPARIQSPSFDVPVSGISMPRRRRSGVGCLVALVVLAVVIAIPVIAVVGLISDATDTIDDVTGTISSLDPERDQPEQPARPPTGIAGTSMVAQPHLVRAIRRIERADIGRIWQLRLAPGQLGVVTVKGTRLRTAQIDYKGAFTRGPETPGGAGARPVAFSAIDAAAPARLVRASRRYGVKPRQINYLVLSNLPGIGLRWVAYFKNGVYVAGDRHGQGPQKISG